MIRTLESLTAATVRSCARNASRRCTSVTEEAIGEHVAHEERLLAALTKRERAQLDDLLRKLLAHVQELD